MVDILSPMNEEEEGLAQGASPSPVQSMRGLSYQDLTFSRPRTSQERTQEREEQNLDAPSGWEAFNLARTQTWATYALLNRRERFEPNPDFMLTTELTKELLGDVPPEMGMYLADAQSLEEAYHLAERLHKDYEIITRMQKLGVGKMTAYYLAGGFTDPVNIALGTVSVPLSGSHKISRLARAIRSGSIAGGTNAAIEGVIINDKPISGVEDVLWAAGLGFALGSGLSSLSKVPEGRLLQEQGRDLMNNARISRDLSEMRANDVERVLDKYKIGELDAQLTRAYLTRELQAKQSDLEMLRLGDELEFANIRTSLDDVQAGGRTRGQNKQDQGGIKNLRYDLDQLKAKLDPSNRSARIGEIKREVMAREGWKGTGKQADTEAKKIYKQEVEDLNAKRLEIEENIARFDELDEANVAAKQARREAEKLEQEGVRLSDETKALQAEVERLQKLIPNIRDLRPKKPQTRTPEENQVEGTLSDSVGAMRANIRETMIKDDDLLRFTEEAMRDPDMISKPVFRWARFDDSAWLTNSKNPLVALTGKNIVADPIGEANYGVSNIAASERQNWLEKKFKTQWRREYDIYYKEWVQSLNKADRQGKTRENLQNEFGAAVANYKRRFNRDPNEHPAIIKATNLADRLFNEWAEHLKNPTLSLGYDSAPIRGFEDLQASRIYVSRLHDSEKMNNMLTEMGGDQRFRQFLQKALMRANKGMKPDAAMDIVTAYLKVLRNQRIGLGRDINTMLNITDIDELKAYLRNTTSLEEMEVDEIVSKLSASNSVEGSTSRAMKRIRFDETYSEVINGKTFRFTDMLENNIDTIFNLYSRQMSGLVAMAQMRITHPKTGEVLIDGIRSEAQWQTFLGKVRTVGDEVGLDGRTIQSEVKKLDTLYKMIRGIPLEADTQGYADILRIARDYQFGRVMGQVGFAQIPEMAMTIGTLGWKAALKGIPALGAFARDARTGRLNNELVAELENLTYVGTDFIRSTVTARYDDGGTTSMETMRNQKLQKVGQGLAHINRAVNVASGMAGVTSALQRWSVNSVVQKFASAIDNPKALNPERMRAIGLSDSEVTQILAQIKKHSLLNKGLLGTEMRLVRMERWDDQVLANKFREAITRLSRRTIQEQDLGMLATWMAHPVWRVILQFRNFVLGAHTNHFLRNLHHRDKEAFGVFMGSMLMGGLTYIGQTHLQSIGRSDREEWLENRLSDENIAKAAFIRGGAFALVPTAVDTVRLAGGFDPLFDFRTSGQANDFIFGNPTSGLLGKDIPNAIEGFLNGEETSQQDIRNLTRTLPFQNVLPVAISINALLNASDLPERPIKD